MPIGPPGAKAPGERPPRPWKALRTRRVGRWPFVAPGPTDLQGTVPRGRGKRGAFPVPARRYERTVTASLAGAIAPATALRRDQDQPGAKAPGQRPPGPAGASRRSGRRWPTLFPNLPVNGAPSRAGGETRVAFPGPVRRGESTVTAAMAGAIAPAKALRRDQDQPGAKAPGQRPTRPWRALPARRVGRWPLLVRVAPVLVAAFRAGGETRCVSCSRPH